MSNRLCEMLGIRYPIFQGGMAWIAESRLASAVSNAGGLGIIGAGHADADTVRDMVRKTKALTDKPFGLNIMLMSPHADDIAQLVLDEKVPAVTTGAGNPGGYLPAFKAAGCRVIPVVPSVALARRMEKIGADAVIAEGMESGGHIGKLTTMALVPQVADAVSIPVIGAGGIADGRGMAAAFMLGAEGVQIGTRFLAAHECAVHPNYKAAVLKANDIATTTTGQITGHPVRVLRNKLARAYDSLEKQELAKETPDIAAIEALGAGTLRKAAVEGDVEMGSVMAGQIAGMVNREQSAAEIVEEIMARFTELTGGL